MYIGWSGVAAKGIFLFNSIAFTKVNGTCNLLLYCDYILRCSTVIKQKSIMVVYEVLRFKVVTRYALVENRYSTFRGTFINVSAWQHSSRASNRQSNVIPLNLVSVSFHDIWQRMVDIFLSTDIIFSNFNQELLWNTQWWLFFIMFWNVISFTKITIRRVCGRPKSLFCWISSSIL